MNFSEKYKQYQVAAEEAISSRCGEMHYLPSVLTDSMRYSLLAGGKRIRPVLFFAALDAFGADFRQETALAVALECIHTYSLIHDDLPAMDNDDFRRGKPSNHKIFGEANAILAGDALLSYAFDLLLKECAKDERHIRAAQCLSRAAGAEGMIAGQSADLLYSGQKGGADELFFIYENKTGRLLSAPLEMAAILSGADPAAAAAFGRDLGILFQLTDDILDEKGESARMGKSVGKDKTEEKLTCVRLIGLKRSEELADEYAGRCRQSLSCFPRNVSFFDAFIDDVRGRDH